MSRHVEIDWNEVRRIMRISVSAGGAYIAPEQQKLCERARRADPIRYRQLHAETKREVEVSQGLRNSES